MEFRPVAVGEGADGRGRGKECDLPGCGTRLGRAVAVGPDRPKAVAQHKLGGSVEQDCAIGERVDRGHVAALFETAGDGALGMEAGVKRGGGSILTCCRGIGAIGVAAAERAGAVPCRKGHGLVEEEELGISAGRHHLSVPVLVGERADDPGPVLPARRAEAAVGAVQDAAVAHEEPARGVGNDLTGGEDTVLERHGGFRLVWKRLGEVLSALDSKLRYLLFPTLRLSCFHDEIGFIA